MLYSIYPQVTLKNFLSVHSHTHNLSTLKFSSCLNPFFTPLSLLIPNKYGKRTSLLSRLECKGTEFYTEWFMSKSLEKTTKVSIHDLDRLRESHVICQKPVPRILKHTSGWRWTDSVDNQAMRLTGLIRSSLPVKVIIPIIKDSRLAMVTVNAPLLKNFSYRQILTTYQESQQQYDTF